METPSMRKIVITLLAFGLFAASTATASNVVRISQVFGGNGTSNAYNQDYIELFNSSGSDVDISGWGVEYSSSASSAVWGGGGSTWQTWCVLPAGSTIKACGYYLVGAALSTGGTPIPTPDFNAASTNMNLSGTTGRVGLFSAYFNGTICTTEGSLLVDKVAYGNSNCPEGATGAPAPSTTLAIFRALGGMTDTDNNSADFATGTPAPRNSSSALNALCTPPVPTTPATWGKVKTIYR
jgi:hypothetical protein